MRQANTVSQPQLAGLKLPYVLFDYSKCNGDGACTDSCPNSAFELSQNRRWCKPKDSLVRNSEALDSYRKKVEEATSPIAIVIRFQIPECMLCWQCIGACPSKAIGVESDSIETREYVIESVPQNFW